MCENNRQITRTQFATITVPFTATLNGLPIGQGKCIGVMFQLNTNEINSPDAPTPNEGLHLVYIGDANSQYWELIPNTGSQPSLVVWCRDLNEVYVRNGGINFESGEVEDIPIQVLIYMGDEDAVSLNPKMI